MTLLDAHLEQIEICSTTIADLPFPQPKIFANAMLNAPDITALIRDTEAHERALFSLAPHGDRPSARETSDNPARRSTAFGIQDEPSHHVQAFRAPRRGTAVAAVLGGDLQQQIKREYNRNTKNSRHEKVAEQDDIDVEVLLKGADRLCGVYPITGASDKIATLRSRNAKALAVMEEYEELVAEQTAQLRKMNGTSGLTFDDHELDEITMQDVNTPDSQPSKLPLTEEELRREEDACAELERKKWTLEERVSGMEKDLGGLMR